MTPDTKPDANGMYWKDGKIRFKTPWWHWAIMIPAMIGAVSILVWGIGVIVFHFL